MKRVAALVVLVAACTSGGPASSAPPSQGPASSARAIVPSSSPSPSAGSAVLVFQLASPPNYTFTLTSADGSVLKTVATTTGPGSAWQAESAGLLLYGPNDADAVLAKDGTITPFPAAVDQIFKFGDPNGVGGSPGDPVFLDSHTALGLSGYLTAKYELIDLVTGATNVLVTGIPTQQSGGIGPPTMLPLGISADRKTARLFIRHATVNGTAIAQSALVEVDLPHKTVDIKPLQLLAGLDAFGVAEPAISGDGKLLAYQEGTRVNPQNVAIYTTHIVEVSTWRDVQIPDTSIQVVGNSSGISFSPDGSALMVYGGSAPATGASDSLMATFATSDGRLLWRDDVGNQSYNMIAPVGWIGEHTLVYTTSTTSVLGNFSNSTPVPHFVDAVSGQTQDLPTNLGSLIAILN